MFDVEQNIIKIYEELVRRNPSITDYKIYVSPAIMKACEWQKGQKVTEYNLTVTINPNIKDEYLEEGIFQSDIWLINDDYN